MNDRIVLASASTIRAKLLKNAGVELEIRPANIDEDLIKKSLMTEGAKPRDIVDALAEFKAQKTSVRFPDALVIGSDQVLDFENRLLTKPASRQDAIQQLTELSGQKHSLYSAAVIYSAGEPVWRHVSQARMKMHSLSQSYIQDYVERNWDDIQYCVGCYQIEAEGVRLFSNVDGDLFTVQGLPLLQLLSYLSLRGVLTR